MTYFAVLLVVLSIPYWFTAIHLVNYRHKMKQGWKWMGIGWVLLAAGFIMQSL